MKKLIFILLAVLSLFIFRIAHAYIQDLNAIKELERLEMAQIEAENARIEHINSLSVKELIEYISPQYGQSTDMIKTIVCAESNFLVLPHDGGQGVNVTGIWDATFDGWLPLYEKENGETLNREATFDQLKMMSWAFSKGDSYRYQWSTYHAYANGGQARIWSRYYGRHFDIKIPKHCW